MRCGREVWPPRPVSLTVSASAAPVSGPARRPTWPTSIVGSQCSAEDVLDAVECAGGDHVERAAGHHLLGRLEEQPDPAGQRRACGAPRPARGRRRPARRCARRGRRRGRRPSTVLDATASPARSSTGSASRSARRATSGARRPGHRSRRAARSSGSSVTASAGRRRALGHERRWCAPPARPSSGWACRSRRSSTSSASRRSRWSTTWRRREERARVTRRSHAVPSAEPSARLRGQAARSEQRQKASGGR